jgi:cytochrome P450
MGRMEEYWDSPLEFIPERWLGENKKPIKMTAYVPFNTGPRTCLGKDMALLEGKIAAVWILQRFTLRLAPNFEPIYQSNLTLKSKNGMLMQFLKR